MNDIHLKKISPMFGTIRIEGTEKEPLFCASDVCKALGFSNPWKAVGDHVDDDDLTKREVIDSQGRKQNTNFISESGLYALIFGSKLPQAKDFKRWVTSEVLPSIRQDGGYMTMADEDIRTSFSNYLDQLRQQYLGNIPTTFLASDYLGNYEEAKKVIDAIYQAD